MGRDQNIMSTTAPTKTETGYAPVGSAATDNLDELKFISDLGRSLLFTVHPKKVAARVVEAIADGVEAAVCVFVAEVDAIGLVSSAFGRNGAIDEGITRRDKIEKWLAFMPPQVGYSQEDRREFLIACPTHRLEYISPIHINGDIRGAIIVGFENVSDFSEKRARLIQAATQMAAMSVNLSAHFETTLVDTVNEAREENRKFNEAVLDALPVSLYVVDRDYRIVSWNRHREVGVLGIPRDLAIGRDVFDVLVKYPKGRVRQEFERAFRTGNIEQIEQQTVADDGSTRHWMVSKVPMKNAAGEVTHVITVGEDVTARVESIHAINRAEKLAAVGRLAAGVVHEINNPLATIAACSEALEQRIAEGAFDGSASLDDLTEYMGLIRSEAFRCKTITMGLLDFSRIRSGERSLIDVGEVIRSSANLISHQNRRDNVSLKVEVEPGLPLIDGDAGLIQQAVIALATNGIDAMENGGELTFRALAQPNRIVIEVTDTGTGIPQENMAKIYEPFFTTKEVGKGTGLGLAVCYSIISEHRGRLNVRSTLGKGTTFSIFLPLRAARAAGVESSE